METWNNFQWISANEVDTKFDSWLLTNRSSFGVRSKLRSKISTFTPFLTFENALAGNKAFYWDNRLLFGGGLRLAPSLSGSSNSLNGRTGITRLAGYVEYVHIVNFYHQTALTMAPTDEVRLGITFSFSNWYNRLYQ